MDHKNGLHDQHLSVKKNIGLIDSDLFRVVDTDPDPDWIRIQRLCGSGSGLGIRIRIQGQEN
jgi:hypothetical protein